MSKDIGKNISKNLSSKYRKKFFGHVKQFAADALKLLLKSISKNSTNSWRLGC